MILSINGNFLQWHKLPPQFLKVMKLTAFLLTIVFLQVNAKSFSQITLSLKQASMEKVFREIEHQTGYGFLYTKEMLTGLPQVTIKVRNATVGEVLNECFRGKSLDYSIENNTIVVTRIASAFAKIPFMAPTALLPVSFEIKGRVVNQEGEPLENVSVLIPGTKIGTTTDKDGHFTLTVPNKNIKLEISSVGYQTKEVKVTGQSEINIILELEVTGLNDVVVVGYGTQKKETLSGSIATVGAKDFENKGSVANPLQALQGQIPGVMISRKSAAPGHEDWNIQIRGASSLNPTDALIVIDGVPAAGISVLNSINPNDIESMSFLKDASASIYGARAAGGVIIVTTKKAKSGKVVIQYDGSLSNKLVGLQPRIMSVQQWAEGLMSARSNDGFTTDDVWFKFGKLAMDNLGNYYDVKATGINPIPSFSDVSDYVFFNNSWTDILWGNASSTQNNLSISGRSSKSGYRLSIGYMDDGSLLKWGNNSNKRYNIRLSNDFFVSDKIKIE